MANASRDYSVRPTRHWGEVAAQLVHGAMCLDLRDQVAAAAPQDWETGTTLLESDEPQLQQAGLVYLLRALVRTPNNTRELANEALASLQAAIEIGAA